MFELTLRLPKDPISPGAARHALDGLGDRLPQDVADRFQLVVSELVTNALMHAGRDDGIKLVARLSTDRLRVAVAQPGPAFHPVIGEPRPGQESGWGLYLVSQLADRWGVTGDDEVVVWCEFELPAPRSAEAHRRFSSSGGERGWFAA